MSSIIVFLSMICPPVGLIGGIRGITKNSHYWKRYVFCAALAIAAFAYCYRPFAETDLVRYISYICSMSNLSLAEALGYNYYGSESLFGFNLICFICAKIGDAYLISAFTTFVIYYIALCVTCRVAFDMNAKKKSIVLYVIFILFALNFQGIINNLRNVFSFSLIGYALFRDRYLKKRNLWTIFLYLFPCFVHSSAIVVLLIRIFIPIIGKFKLISTFVILFIPTILKILDFIFTKFSSSNIVFFLIKNSITKGLEYFSDTSSAWGIEVQGSLVAQTSRIVYIGIAVLICILCIYMERNKHHFEPLLNQDAEIYLHSQKVIIDFVYAMCLLTISCVTMLTPGYWRFSSIYIIFGAIIFIPFFEVSISKNTYIVSRIPILLSPICLIAWCVNMNCDMITFLFKPFLSSPIIIAFKGLIKLFWG